MSYLYNIIIPIKLNKAFTYSSKTPLLSGDIVLVSFANRQKLGVVWEELEGSSVKNIKEVKKIICKGAFAESYLKFIKKFAEYNFISLGQVAELILPAQDILQFRQVLNVYYLGEVGEVRVTGKRKELLAVFEKGSFIRTPHPASPARGEEFAPLPLRERLGEGLDKESPYYCSHRNYAVYIKEFARNLRKEQTVAEKKLWKCLRDSNLEAKFRRQFAVDNKYIADFICLEKRLIIELDGGQHCEGENEIVRSFYLEEKDFRIIRFWNNEVLGNIDGCLEVLSCEVEKDFIFRTPHPNPLPQGERGLAEEFLLQKGFAKSYLREQVKVGFLRKKEVLDFVEIEPIYQKTNFSKEQEQVIGELAEIVVEKKFSCNLINGVTGSGKTEIYFALIEKILEQNKKGQVLILVPEILLTKQFIEKFEKRFLCKPKIWHSSSKVKDKSKAWYEVSGKNVSVIIGTRSSLFLPFTNLQLIIIDEEHDSSYKQEEKIIYNGRDAAILRGFIENIPVVLGSATVSLESNLNVVLGKYKEFFLKERFGKSVFPEVCLIDLKKEKMVAKKWVSPSLQKAIKDTVARGEQVIIFLNRRGYAPLKICDECGYRFKCDDCDSYLVEHRKKNILSCHYCELKIKNTNDCPNCSTENKMISFGTGVERIVEELQVYFPENKITQITADETRNQQVVEDIFNEIEEGEIDIIVGTQVISKGHHFKNLTLVGVLDGDIGDSLDIRASERFFQLMQQIAGRAGREEKKGRILIQSFNPNSEILQLVKNNQIEEFYQLELANRKRFNVPPYSKLIAFIISDKDQEKAKITALDLVRYFKKFTKIQALGPAEAPMFFLRGKYRFRILLKAAKAENIKDIIEPIMDKILSSKVQIKIDVDPFSFY